MKGLSTTELWLVLQLIGQSLGDIETQLPVFREEPRWWQFRDRWADRRLRSLLRSAHLPDLTPEGRQRFHEQVREGQGYDDANGYHLRCWQAAFGWDFKPAWESSTLPPIPTETMTEPPNDQH